MTLRMRMTAITLDCPDPEALAAFYRRATGLAPHPRSDGDFAALVFEDGLVLGFQRVDGLWGRLAEWAENVPAREYERLRRVGELRGHRVDSTHPPTHLRRRLLAEGEAFPARVTVNAATTAAIDGELAGMRRQVARDVVTGAHHG
ncbi:VOC family protein [Streptomyces sp. NPDC058745]|uniref:VOC family protein n=1 Tax=Streptomyces sp. NPDC058745 TaxID=3346621 RepID=UPI003683677A